MFYRVLRCQRRMVPYPCSPLLAGPWWVMWLQRMESNHLPQGYEPCELPMLYAAEIVCPKKNPGKRELVGVFDLIAKWVETPCDQLA